MTFLYTGASDEGLNGKEEEWKGDIISESRFGPRRKDLLLENGAVCHENKDNTFYTLYIFLYRIILRDFQIIIILPFFLLLSKDFKKPKK